MAKIDCWLIGNSLRNDSYRYLREMSTNTLLLQLPYLCRFYDVNAFTKSPLCPDSVITHLRNSVMQDINEMDRLPKRIVFILDDEILKITHLTGETALKWLYTEVERYINAKKDQLPMKCIMRGEPKIVTVKHVPIPPRNRPETAPSSR